MLIVLDHNIPRGAGKALRNHTVKEAQSLGWATLSNGELLRAAESQAFDVLVTADQDFRFQQNLKKRRIAVVVLSKGQWPYIKPVVSRVADAVNSAKPGTVTLVDIPLPPRKRRRSSRSH